MAYHVAHLIVSATSHVHALAQFHPHSLAMALQGQWQQAAPTPVLPAAPGGGVHPNVGGCVDSPEAPSGILLMVGAMGLAAGSMMMRKLAPAVKRAGLR